MRAAAGAGGLTRVRAMLSRLRDRDRGRDRPLPQVAVMTMVRDEAVMLPRWVDHYAAQVGHDHLIVLDDNSVDGSTDGLPCTVHRIPGLPGAGYERARMRLVSGLADGLLATYDYVVFVDADEFLVPDPRRHPDLRHFLAERPDADVVAPMALNVVHVPGEGALEPGEPVLGQRHHVVFTPIMCKPSVKRVPAAWQRASHGIDVPFTVDPELYMVHLKFADRDALVRSAAHRQALVAGDGRGRGSNWSRGSELVDVLDRVGATATGAVPEFDPAGVDLEAIVRHKDDCYRAVGLGQVQALEKMPLQRVPGHLLGTV